MNSVGVGETIASSGQITYNTYQWNSVAKQTHPGGSIMEYAYDPLKDNWGTLFTMLTNASWYWEASGDVVKFFK